LKIYRCTECGYVWKQMPAAICFQCSGTNLLQEVAKDEQSPEIYRSSIEVTEPRLESSEVVMEEGVDRESGSNPDSA